MPSQKALYHALRYRLRDLPYQIVASGNTLRIQIDETRKALWKGSSLSFAPFKKNFESFSVDVQNDEILLNSQFNFAHSKNFLNEVELMADKVARENLHDTAIWGSFPTPHATGFKEGALPESSAFLNEVYADKFIVPEKKAFVIDLRRSFRSHLISADKDPHSFFDAASQIGSLALGYNDPEKRGLETHPENFEWDPKVFESETYTAYTALLKNLSQMPHVYFFNSGAEANEAALQLCIRKFPKRKKLLAFSGSFHGRSFLTIHLTHSPAKRLPFETYPGIVNFAPYPENKNPRADISVSSEWISLWGNAKSADFEAKLKEFSETSDPLLKAEVESLLYVKKAFGDEDYLATMVEPRQCEGGDRFGTKRFYSALRLLTRAYDVPLIFDEVQTGFGLGGPFFWNELFDLKKVDGSPDHPDCLTFAKKGQVAGLLSLIEGPLKHEVSLASLHRGYIQAMSTLVHEAVDFPYVMKRIEEVQKLVGNGIIQNPRGQAQTFAFDLPTDTLLNKLISYRFQEGILFYPAGERTARFRLLRNFKKVEIDGLFTSLYRCFLKASADKLIPEIPPLEKWLEKIPPESREMFNLKALTRTNPWQSFPRQTNELKKLSPLQWQQVFTSLIKEQRNCIHLNSNLEWNLDKLNQSSLDDLVAHYEKTPDFTWLDLMWHGSRQQGLKVERLHKSSQLQQLKEQIEILQSKCYEPARQTPFKDFESCLSESKGLVLTYCEKGELKGLAAAASISKFNELKLLCDDKEKNNPQTFYSIDVTVSPELLNLGLGLRLKAEQIIELTHDGVTSIRSRNRYPEASPMIRLNHGFGSQVIALGDNVYSDGGSAFYQSLRLYPEAQKIWNPRHPSLFNKGSLANFVSPAYIDNMLILKELLPKKYRHVYLASSRAEALDKAIKCLRFLRPKGQSMFSFEGDHFGNTTASTATLSGETHYFNWPQFKDHSESKFTDWLKTTPNESIFGCALEWQNNSEVIKQRIDHLRTLRIPSVLKECRSAFWQGSKSSFLLSAEAFDPDILYFGLGPQVAVVACTESFFIDKPLTMISTWDGDEHGLCLFQDQVWSSLERRQ